MPTRHCPSDRCAPLLNSNRIPRQNPLSLSLNNLMRLVPFRGLNEKQASRKGGFLSISGHRKGSIAKLSSFSVVEAPITEIGLNCEVLYIIVDGGDLLNIKYLASCEYVKPTTTSPASFMRNCDNQPPVASGSPPIMNSQSSRYILRNFCPSFLHLAKQYSPLLRLGYISR